MKISSGNLLSLIFPAQCLGCETALGVGFHATDYESAVGSEQNDSLSLFDHHWCQSCWRLLTNDLAKPNCSKCGAFLSSASPLPNGCAHCHTRVFPFERAIALGNYTGLLQTLTLKAKNLKDESLTIQLANLLAFRLQEYSFCDELDLVVPVSTHWWTRLKRGFHAAEILGQIVSQRLEIPCGNSCLKSLKLAKKQGTLSANERYKNVRATFGVRKLSKVQGKKILVIDDVLTSGATASEVSKELLKAGASQVYVGVVARAVGDH